MSGMTPEWAMEELAIRSIEERDAARAEARSVPTRPACATCGHYADGHDFTPPNDCHATPTCDCETGYVPTRPDEPLTVERLTAALVKVGGLHRYTWEEYATAIIAALDMTADPVERAVESLNRAGEGQFTDHDLAVAVSGEEGSEARCTCGHLESEHLDHQDACIHSVIDFLERAVERIEAGETVHGSVVGCSCERFIPDTAQRSGGE